MKHTLNTLLSFILFMLIVSVTTLLFLLNDQRWLKEQAQDYITDLTGRSYQIEGSLHISFSQHPSIKVERIWLANTDWAEEDAILRLEKLQVSFDLWSLLTNQVKFDFIELEGLAIALEENGQGDVNWDLFSATDNEVKLEVPENHLPFQIDRLLLENIHVLYKTPDQQKALNFILARLKAEKMTDDQTSLTAHGSIGELPESTFEMTTSLIGGDSQYTLQALQAKLGASNLSGKIDLGFREELSITGNLHSTFLDLGWLTKTNKQKQSVTQSTQKYFPDKAIPLIDFENLNIKLNLSAERIKLDYTELSAVEFDVSLHEKYLHIDSFKFGGPVGERVSGKLTINATDGVPQLDFTTHGNHLRLYLAATDNQDVTTLPKTDVAIDLHGKGATYHQLASSLNGKIRIALGKGLVANAGLGLLFSDFLSKLFITLNPYAQNSKYTELECSIIKAKIKSGEVFIKPFIIQTSQVTILSEGNINLATEEIDMIFESKVRKGVGISLGGVVYPFIKLGGKLSSPSIELDPVSAGISGSVAVATYGLSLVAKSLYDRFLSSKDPCGEAIKR